MLTSKLLEVHDRYGEIQTEDDYFNEIATFNRAGQIASYLREPYERITWIYNNNGDIVENKTSEGDVDYGNDTTKIIKTQYNPEFQKIVESVYLIERMINDVELEILKTTTLYYYESEGKLQKILERNSCDKHVRIVKNYHNSPNDKSDIEEFDKNERIRTRTRKTKTGEVIIESFEYLSNENKFQNRILNELDDMGNIVESKHFGSNHQMYKKYQNSFNDKGELILTNLYDDNGNLMTSHFIDYEYNDCDQLICKTETKTTEAIGSDLGFKIINSVYKRFFYYELDILKKELWTDNSNDIYYSGIKLYDSQGNLIRNTIYLDDVVETNSLYTFSENGLLKSKIEVNGDIIKTNYFYDKYNNCVKLLKYKNESIYEVKVIDIKYHN